MFVSDCLFACFPSQMVACLIVCLICSFIFRFDNCRQHSISVYFSISIFLFSFYYFVFLLLLLLLLSLLLLLLLLLSSLLLLLFIYFVWDDWLNQYRISMLAYCLFSFHLTIYIYLFILIILARFVRQLDEYFGVDINATIG